MNDFTHVLNITLGAALYRLRQLGWEDFVFINVPIKAAIVAWFEKFKDDQVDRNTPPDTALHVVKAGIEIANRFHAARTN